ncbi:hypothetical protein Tco_1001217 [Tanacetum coccineum]
MCPFLPLCMVGAWVIGMSDSCPGEIVGDQVMVLAQGCSSMVSCSGAVGGDEGSDVGSVIGVGGMVVVSGGAS